MNSTVEWQKIRLIIWCLISSWSCLLISGRDWWRHFVLKLLGYYKEIQLYLLLEGFGCKGLCSFAKQIEYEMSRGFIWCLEQHANSNQFSWFDLSFEALLTFNTSFTLCKQNDVVSRFCKMVDIWKMKQRIKKILIRVSIIQQCYSSASIKIFTSGHL